MIQLWKDKHKMSKEKTYQCWRVGSLEQGISAKGQDLQMVTGNLLADVFKRCFDRELAARLAVSQLGRLRVSFAREMLFSLENFSSQLETPAEIPEWLYDLSAERLLLICRSVLTLLNLRKL